MFSIVYDKLYRGIISEDDMCVVTNILTGEVVVDVNLGESANHPVLRVDEDAVVVLTDEVLWLIDPSDNSTMVYHADDVSGIGTFEDCLVSYDATHLYVNCEGDTSVYRIDGMRYIANLGKDRVLEDNGVEITTMNNGVVEYNDGRKRSIPDDGCMTSTNDVVVCAVDDRNAVITFPNGATRSIIDGSWCLVDDVSDVYVMISEYDNSTLLVLQYDTECQVVRAVPESDISVKCVEHGVDIVSIGFDGHIMFLTEYGMVVSGYAEVE